MRDGNRIFKGDTETQAVYDNYDVMSDEGRKKAMGHWEDTVGHDMNAADRWAYKNKNLMAKADEWAFLHGKDAPQTRGSDPSSFVNPYEGQTSDFYDYSSAITRGRTGDKNLQKKYTAAFDNAPSMKRDFLTSMNPAFEYGFNVREKGAPTLLSQKRAVDEARASAPTLGSPQRTPQMDAPEVDSHPLAQNTAWATDTGTQGCT